ncbi:hypothetical protein NIES4071_90690 [Calothrix sp. NIES-4071]|nr:hypothetical protein NIES4071_90690 [Calothrix sp. NIES-4071]BAZ63336.1 hypothetical protein NIES4105_90620 [Calothrix sp. NIES-4105]
MRVQLLRRSLDCVVLFATAITSVLISSTGLAATSNSTGAIAIGCTCNGKPIPERLCRIIHCPDTAITRIGNAFAAPIKVNNNKLAETRVGNGKTVDPKQPSRKILGHLVGNG